MLAQLLEEASARLEEEKEQPGRKRGKQALKQALDPLRNMKQKDWNKVLRQCPHCDRPPRAVAKSFGVTVQRGREKPQSWCYECRAAEQYYKKARKYNLSK